MATGMLGALLTTITPATESGYPRHGIETCMTEGIFATHAEYQFSVFEI